MNTSDLVVITLIVVVTILVVGEYIRGKELDSINDEPFDDKHDDITVEASEKLWREQKRISDRSLDDYAS